MNPIRSLLLALLAAQPLLLCAQDAGGDFMRSIGKIYVVAAVILALFLGIVLFLIRLDRKLNRLENQLDENDQTPT